MLIRLNKKIFPVFFALLSLICFLSCHKDINEEQVTTETPDLSSRAFSSVSGFVTDENNVPVQGASVQVGITAGAVLTDLYGYFEVKDVEVSKIAATVTVSKAGYFKGIKTWTATSGKAAFFRIKLIPKTIAGTISASSGGNVSLSNGLVIALPSNGVVKASDNSAYTGNIHVAVSWLDPEATDLVQTMPGDLRGIDESGAMKGLTTFGMTAVELTNDAGELLQIAPGKKATITMPLSATTSANAPATIPLWYFNESNGLWKQESSATKTGNSYTGDVTHFSFWNYDQPGTIVQFNCTIVDGSGNPVPYVAIKISDVSNPNVATWAYTDASGYVNGYIPINSSLLLEIFTNYECGNAIHSQNFSSATTDISLGNISISTSSNIATITGTATDCSGAALTNGYIMANNYNQLYRYPVSSTGTFDFTTLVCNGSSVVSFIAEDATGLQQSQSSNHLINTGANAIGNLQACGVSVEQFVRYTLDGGTTWYTFTSTSPTDSIWATADLSQEVVEVFCNYGSNGASWVYIDIFNQENLWYLGNDWHSLIYFGSDQTPEAHTTATSSPPIAINITEAGPIGGFISGDFTGTMTGTATPVIYNVSCSFRIRRTF